MTRSASGTPSGVGLSVTAMSSVQFGAALATTLFARVGPVGTVGLRLSAGAIVLVVLIRPWRQRWKRADLASSALFGCVFAAMNASLYLALDRLPLATVVTLEFLGPLVLTLVTAVGWTVRVWALPAAAGVVLLSGGLTLDDAVGVAFALSAACCWAGYIVLAGRLGRSGTGLAGLALSCVVGALVTLPIGTALAGSALFRPGTLVLGLGIGVLSSAIPYSLDLLALRRLPTAVFGVLTSLNPGVAAVAGLLVLSQALPARELIGVGLVTIASIGVTTAPLVLGRRRRNTTGEATVSREVDGSEAVAAGLVTP